MRLHIGIVSLAFWLISSPYIFGQEVTQPEPQVTFVDEKKPHSYYVRQAELWWEETQKDRSSETNWYNYYRACRNAHGTANWNKDFVEESPSLRLGADIIQLMEQHIPETFTLYYVKGADWGADPAFGEYLKKAYQMNPNFRGIHASMVSLAQSTHDMKLRREVNQQWFMHNNMAPGFMTYGYNMLQSVLPNGIVLTQGDNDTYPAWMLKDAKNIRPDVTIINIDFLLVESYRDPIFKELDIPPFALKNIDVNEYEFNWKNIAKHLLTHYKGNRPLHLSMTVSKKYYEGFEDNMNLCGLTWKYGEDLKYPTKENMEILLDRLLLDHLKVDLIYSPAQGRVDEINTHYLHILKLAREAYKKLGDEKEVATYLSLGEGIIEKIDGPNQQESLRQKFQ
ncbi:MAG: hypothetical protein AAFQ83_01705 [Bacteroidota bacterium]